MHSIIYSRIAEADRALLRSVLGFPAVDAGRGSLIFSVPPSEIAFCPAERNSKHKLDLMCDDVKAEVV